MRQSRINSLAGTAYFAAILPFALLAPFVAMALWLLWFPVARVLVHRLTGRAGSPRPRR